MLHAYGPYFQDEQAAYAFVESHVWPEGAICPRCGCGDRVGKMAGRSTRIGTYKCYRCRKPFTVKVGTIFEASHLPLHLWLQAIYLMAVTQERLTGRKLEGVLGVAPRTAAQLIHRTRKSLRGIRRAAESGAAFPPI